MTEQLLNRAKVRAIREQMSGESMPQRVWMQVPVDVDQAHVLLDDAADGTLAQPAPGVIEKHRLRMRIAVAKGYVRLLPKLFPHRPVFLQRFLRFFSVRNDSFFVSLAAHPQHALLLLDVQQI